MSNDQTMSQESAESHGERARRRTLIFPGQRDILHQPSSMTTSISQIASPTTSPSHSTTIPFVSTTSQHINDLIIQPDPPSLQLLRTRNAAQPSPNPIATTRDINHLQLPVPIDSAPENTSNYAQHESIRHQDPGSSRQWYGTGLDYSQTMTIAGPSTNPHNLRTNSQGDVSSERVLARQLRRYLGTEDIPGEGSFHIYDDGYRIPAEVHGERVNPVWGLTKANKPRKRLALACISCRNKKIKCDPGMHGCLQCERAQIVCKRGSKRFGLPAGEETYEVP